VTKQSRLFKLATIMKQPAVYIMTNQRNGTLYTGVTSDLPKRVYEHKNGVTGGFATKHGCQLLVYFVMYDDMRTAIAEEKRIKGGSRKQKLALIEAINRDWKDLYPDIV